MDNVNETQEGGVATETPATEAAQDQQPTASSAQGDGDGGASQDSTPATEA